MAFKNLRSRAAEPEAPRPSLAAVEPVSGTTFLDEGCELVGQLRFRDPVRIDGRVEGEIHSDSSVVVGAPAAVEANIRAESVVVHGSVEGEIVAERKITLHETARVVGDLQTAGIVIEEGARFRGCIVIGDGDAEAASPSPPEAERSDAETIPG